MSKVEILLATVNRKNLDFLADMNIQTDLIIANQSDVFSSAFIKAPYGNIKFVTTLEKGVGRNRNITLANSTAPICMFADDDNRYIDNYEDEIIKAFQKCPKADVLIFDCFVTGQRIKVKSIKDVHRVRVWNFCRYGTCRIAIRRSSWKKKKVFFSELYGGGSIYNAGEDVLFLRECLQKKLKIYTYPKCIVQASYENSSWFHGYDEKFFYDNGSLIGAAFPYMKYIVWPHFFLKYLKCSSLSWRIALYFMIAGMKGQKDTLSYHDYIQKSGSSIIND